MCFAGASWRLVAYIGSHQSGYDEIGRCRWSVNHFMVLYGIHRITLEFVCLHNLSLIEHCSRMLDSLLNQHQ
jgi:hypothetical protein